METMEYNTNDTLTKRVMSEGIIGADCSRVTSQRASPHHRTENDACRMLRKSLKKDSILVTSSSNPADLIEVNIIARGS